MEPPKPNSIQGLHASLPLAQKIALIQAHVEANHFGDKTIPHCMPHDGGPIGSVRPWTLEDFEGQSVSSFRCNKPGEPVQVTSADWLNYENSTSFSGEYLLSQVYRYEATQEEAVLAECNRALTALQAIAQLALPDQFGWLCKPFGGRLSAESSPDQNICALSGLWAFLPHANHEQAAWIREVIAAIPRYWEGIDYTIDFSDHIWDIRNDVSHMRIFQVANRLAHHVTGEAAFQETAKRLAGRYGRFSAESASLFDTYDADRPGFFADWRRVTEFAGATLLFAPLCIDLLCDIEPGFKSQYLQALARALEHGLIGLDPAWFGHYYQHEVKSVMGGYLWRPLEHEQPDTAARQRIGGGNFAIYEYPHRIYWFDATSRLPLAYLLYLKQGGAPLPGIERHVREVMNRLDFLRLHWMVDPHNDQTIPELQYVLHALTSEVSNYLAAYWLGQSLNFWDG